MKLNLYRVREDASRSIWIAEYDLQGNMLKIYPSKNEIIRQRDLNMFDLKHAIEDGVILNGFLYREYEGLWFPQKPVINNVGQFDAFTGKMINRFSTIEEATTMFDLPKKKVIHMLARDDLDKYGCFWRSLDKEKNLSNPPNMVGYDFPIADMTADEAQKRFIDEEEEW